MPTDCLPFPVKIVYYYDCKTGSDTVKILHTLESTLGVADILPFPFLDQGVYRAHVSIAIRRQTIITRRFVCISMFTRNFLTDIRDLMIDAECCT